MPRASITLMPLADTFRVMVRLSDGTKNFFFCTFGSKRRFVRRCECEMLCPKPGTAPVTWHTAAMVSFLIWLPWDERPTQGHLSARHVGVPRPKPWAATAHKEGRISAVNPPTVPDVSQMRQLSGALVRLGWPHDRDGACLAG